MRKRLVLLLLASTVAMLSLEVPARAFSICPEACRPDGCCQRCRVPPGGGSCQCNGIFTCS
jgi:hypothetical protein